MHSVPRRTTGPSRDEKKAMTRQRLLDAAAVVFARKGITAASLDDVADEAGLTKGAVYSNFGNKAELISTLLDQRLGEPSFAIAPNIGADLPQAEQAKQAGQQFMSLVDREREAYVLELEFMLWLVRNPDSLRSSNYDQRVHAMADEIRTRSEEHGRTLPLPAEELAQAVFALGTGLAFERLVDPTRVPPDLFGKMLALIFSGGGDASGAKRG